LSARLLLLLPLSCGRPALLAVCILLLLLVSWYKLLLV